MIARQWTLYSASLSVVFAILLAVPSSALAQSDEITVKEWVVPTLNSAPHDVVVDKNGIAWFTEINTNKIGRLDPKTDEFQEFDIPTLSSRPHGLVVDNDNGNVWFTEMASSKIGKLDTETKKMTEFPTPTPNSAPHTPIMGKGVVWFTEIEASKIGRLNVTSGMIDEFTTPTRGSSPYGIIVDSEGNAWYAALTGHMIGKVDAKTGQITEYPTPTSDSGTRRIAIDSKGKLWFTEYNTAKIGSFDPMTNEFKEYETVSESSNPYAIWVDIYDNVWFSMTGAFKVGKFDQSTNTIKEYELPTPRTIIRFIYSDMDGNIWFPNNNNNKIGVITQTAQQPTYPCDGKEFVGIAKNYTVIIEGTEYSGSYFGSASNVTANVEKTALEIDATTDCIVIELPRELIDSTRDGQDVPFTVLVDGQVSNATNEEIESSGNRVLEINLSANSAKKIEIVGTSIAPEFGSIAIVFISMAMIGIFLLAKSFSRGLGYETRQW